MIMADIDYWKEAKELLELVFIIENEAGKIAAVKKMLSSMFDSGYEAGKKYGFSSGYRSREYEDYDL